METIKKNLVLMIPLFMIITIVLIALHVKAIYA